MKSSVPPAAFDARASSLGTEKTLRKPLRHSKSAAYARQQATANQDPRGPTATTLLVSTGRQPTAFPLPPLKHTNRAKSGATTVARRSFVTQLTGDCQGRENRLSRTTAPSRAPRCTAGVLLPVTGAFTAPSDSRAAAVSFAKSSGSTLPDVQNHIGSLSDDTDWAADPGTSLSWASSNSTSAGSSVIYSSENRQHSRPETRKNNTSAPSRAQTALTLTRMAGSGRKSKQTARHLKDFECVSLVDVPLPKPERTPVDLSPYMTEGDERPAERTAPTQTDELQPLRGDEPYMPAKRGINASTQLFGDEELFDFADEVSPLVEVLVWKTLEEVQSELVHEGELEEMAAYREACEQRCRARLDREAQAERLEWQRVENMRKLIEFNERRIEEEGLLIRKLLAVEAAERTPFYPLVEGCLDGLQAQGAFIEDNTVAVQTVAMLQLNKDVKARLAQLVLLENATKSLIRTEIFREASSTERVQREHEEHARMRRIRDRRVMDIRRGRLRFTLRVEDVPQPVAPSPAVARSSVRSEEDKNEDESEREENEESSDREDGDGSSPSDPVSSLSGAAVVTQETQVAPRIPRAAGRRETGQASEADRRVRSGPEEAEEAQMKDGEGNTSRRSSDDPQRYVQGSMNVGSVKAGDLPSKEPHQKETWKKRQTLGTSGATDESKTSNLGSEPVNATEDNQQNSGSHINPRFCLTSDLSADAESGASSETETETQADEHSQSQGQGVFSADVVVGPLIVVKCSETRECFTIEEVRGAIWAWISEHVPELAARAHAGFDVVWKNAVQESVAPLLQSFPGELYLKARPAIVVPQGHEQTTEPTDE